jgi:very-short-patch-repair endonuclease
MPRLKDTIEKTMFYGAKPIIFERAKAMRQNPTNAEKVLWDILNKNQILGLRFKFQHPISQFIADFYCHKIKLVVEADGEIHSTMENKEKDEGRDDEMERLGIKTLRFTNEAVIHDLEGVKKSIENKCLELLGSMTPPPHPPTP